MAMEDRGKLGRFRKPLLELLRRDPAQRATARQFCRHMFQIFSSSAGATAVAKDAMPVPW